MKLRLVTAFASRNFNLLTIIPVIFTNVVGVVFPHMWPMFVVCVVWLVLVLLGFWLNLNERRKELDTEWQEFWRKKWQPDEQSWRGNTTHRDV